MTPIKRKLLYIFRGTLLRLRIKWAGQELTLSVGYHVDRTDDKGKLKWDGERCMRNTTHGKDRVPATVINVVLDRLEKKVAYAFSIYEKLDAVPTKELLKTAINGESDNGEPIFFKAFNEYLREGREVLQWSDGTVKKLQTLKKLLMKFDPNATFDSFNSDKLKELMSFQTRASVSGKSKKESKKESALIHYKGKYKNDTINKNIQNVRTFLKWAVSKGYTSGLDSIDFNLKYRTAKKPVIFLNWEELMSVWNIDLSEHPELDKTRDMFCFCCFTSLRYSDMTNLKWANITSTSIRLVTKKTVDALEIELNDYSKAILDKYRSGDYEMDDKVFSQKSPQKFNVRIKQICKMCNINTPILIVQLYGTERIESVVAKYKLISSHCGRRTFISNALAMGIPPNVVMKWTGHSDYKAMLPYIEIADKVKEENMRKFNMDSE